jgi:opacity protein-like surface antigen
MIQAIRKYGILILVLGMVVAFAGVAGAAQPENYMAFRLGVATPTGDLEDFDAGPYVEVAFGHYFNPNFALEGSIGGTLFSSPNDYDYEVYPFQVNAKGILPLDNAQLYAMFGLGFYHTYYEFVDNSNTLFGYDLGVGGLVKLSDTVSLGAELKYFAVEEADWGAEVEGTTFTANFQVSF